MDLLKKFTGSKDKKPQEGQPQGQAGQAGQPAGQPEGQQKEDYGDKAFGFASKHLGLKLSKDQQEGITDGARGAYEKSTGKKVDPKYSN